VREKDLLLYLSAFVAVVFFYLAAWTVGDADCRTSWHRVTEAGLTFLHDPSPPILILSYTYDPPFSFNLTFSRHDYFNFFFPLYETCYKLDESAPGSPTFRLR